MPSKFTPKAQSALNNSLTIASEMGHSYIGSEHILLGLLTTPDCAAQKILANRGVTADKVKAAIIRISGTGTPDIINPTDMTPRSKKIIEASASEPISAGNNYIGTEHLLLSLVTETDCVGTRIIESLGVSPSDIKTDAENYLAASPAQNVQRRQNHTTRGHASAILNYGRDLTEMAAKGSIDPIIGRDRETERVIQILSRRTKNNPCLIGEPGVGKTAVVEGLAQRIADGNVPEALREKSIIMLDIPSMIAGAKYRGEFEERLKNVLSEAAKNLDLIIFIDEIHTIIGAGAAEGAVDAANIIKPALARGQLRVIGATTISEYRKHIEKDSALERRFQSVTVGEPTTEESINILRGLRAKYEAHHKLTITDGAIDSAVYMSQRYIPDRFLPDKAIDLIDEAASKLRISAFTSPPAMKEMENELTRIELEKAEAITGQNFELAAELRDKEKKLRDTYDQEKILWEARKNDEGLRLTERSIAEVVEQWTTIPVSQLVEDESKRLLGLSDYLKSKIIDQDRSAEEIARAIQRGRTGLKAPERPIGSFIFAGPTGVGKTEMAKVLSEALFGNSRALIRFDMSEYMEKHSISKLIGSPPGYVGYDEGGLLTEKIRRRPYSVVLFDEIEKAHPDIFNVLLQLLDDGILTDSQGRQADFRNAIIIMTSNIGSSNPIGTKTLGFSTPSSVDDERAQEEKRVMSQIAKAFRPEFLNRIDSIIVFNRLSDDSLKKIARLMLDELSERISKLGISIEFLPEVTNFIVNTNIDRSYGARQIRRSIVQLVEDRFSEAMLEGKIKAKDRVRCAVENDKIVFKSLQAVNGASL